MPEPLAAVCCPTHESIPAVQNRLRRLRQAHLPFGVLSPPRIQSRSVWMQTGTAMRTRRRLRHESIAHVLCLVAGGLSVASARSGPFGQVESVLFRSTPYLLADPDDPESFAASSLPAMHRRVSGGCLPPGSQSVSPYCGPIPSIGLSPGSSRRPTIGGLPVQCPWSLPPCTPCVLLGTAWHTC